MGRIPSVGKGKVCMGSSIYEQGSNIFKYAATYNFPDNMAPADKALLDGLVKKYIQVTANPLLEKIKTLVGPQTMQQIQSAFAQSQEAGALRAISSLSMLFGSAAGRNYESQAHNQQLLPKQQELLALATEIASSVGYTVFVGEKGKKFDSDLYSQRGGISSQNSKQILTVAVPIGIGITDATGTVLEKADVIIWA